MESYIQFTSLQSLSHVQLFTTPWIAAHYASLSITNFPVQHQSWSNSCPSSHWCHPNISPSAISFSSHLQSFPASGSFQMSQLFTPAGQSIGSSASTSVLPMNTQDWSPLGWTSWIPRDFQESSPTPQFRSINSLALSLLYGLTPISIHDYWKNHSFD